MGRQLGAFVDRLFCGLKCVGSGPSNVVVFLIIAKRRSQRVMKSNCHRAKSNLILFFLQGRAICFVLKSSRLSDKKINQFKINFV